MPISLSLFEMNGAPPSDFSPGRMLNGVKGPWLHDIQVSIPKVTIGARSVESSTADVQFNVRQQPERIIPLSLEIGERAGVHARLEDIPFHVVVHRKGVSTLSSEKQKTPWRFLVRINSESKQMSLSFTFNYSGLSVDEALKGVSFYRALPSGGEFRIQGRHPHTGGALPIARGAIPAGAYQLPDVRFVEILHRLAVIKNKAGVSFTIPERNISFEEANTIVATAHILETGHAEYTAKDWVSVSNVEQANNALETFAMEKYVPMAIHFEGQVVVIFGRHVMLGPVTFFCDRTYITDEDLVDLRKQLDTANVDDKINIRFTPFEDCSVEARYINWLPQEEANAIKALPMYRAREPVVHEDQFALPLIDVANAVALLKSWYDEDAEEQREMWESIKLALDQDRLSDRKLFP